MVGWSWIRSSGARELSGQQKPSDSPYQLSQPSLLLCLKRILSCSCRSELLFLESWIFSLSQCFEDLRMMLDQP